jgi:2-methylcitrate dehydratase PrpD
VDVDVHRLAVQAAGIERPASGLEAKFSLRHTVAQAVLAYPLVPGLFTDAAATDPVLSSLRERVRVSVDEGFAYDEAMPARVRLTTTAGATHLRYVDVPRGRPGNPMTDGELGAKFRSLAEPVLGAAPASDVLERLWDLRTMPDVGPLARLLGR